MVEDNDLCDTGADGPNVVSVTDWALEIPMMGIQ